MTNVHVYIDEHFDGTVARLVELCRLPTVSAQDKIACELLTRAYASLLTGIRPDSQRLWHSSTVPMRTLKPLLTPKQGARR